MDQAVRLTLGTGFRPTVFQSTAALKAAQVPGEEEGRRLVPQNEVACGACEAGAYVRSGAGALGRAHELRPRGRRNNRSKASLNKSCVIENTEDGLLWRGGPMVARPSSLGSVQTSRALAQCQRCPRVPPTGSQNTSLNQKTSAKGIDPHLLWPETKTAHPTPEGRLHFSIYV